MASRANIPKSVTNFKDYYRRGVTLKCRKLKNWIKRKGYTQSFVAELLCMSKQKLRRKLYRRERFNQSEIADLIRLMGARTAVEVIWFPTLQEKKRIKSYVCEGQMSNKYNLKFPHQFEMPLEMKRRRIEEQYKKSGENWEQSEEFEEYIFDLDELPSHRFMRRRKNG